MRKDKRNGHDLKGKMRRLRKTIGSSLVVTYEIPVGRRDRKFEKLPHSALLKLKYNYGHYSTIKSKIIFDLRAQSYVYGDIHR